MLAPRNSLYGRFDDIVAFALLLFLTSCVIFSLPYYIPQQKTLYRLCEAVWQYPPAFAECLKQAIKGHFYVFLGAVRYLGGFLAYLKAC
jgi:hypothetical protein